MFRRDAIYSILGTAAASRLLAGCDDEDEPRGEAIGGELLGQNLGAGHLLRDGDLRSEIDFASVSPRRVPIAIVGGGVAGLAAAWRLHHHGVTDAELFELESTVGGTSRSGRSSTTPFPWGAHYLPVPMPENTALLALLREVDALEPPDARGVAQGAERLLIRQPAERIFYRGYWYEGLFVHAGATEADYRDLRRLRRELDRYTGLRVDGRRAFTIPLDRGATNDAMAALDQRSAAHWLDQLGIESPRVRFLIDYACRDDYGLLPTEASAWAAIWYYAARTFAPGEETMELLAWPEGNGALVEPMARTLGPRAHTARMAVAIEPQESGVRIELFDPEQQRPEVVIADRAIVALPRFVARRIVEPLRSTPSSSFDAPYGAWMVANLELRSRPLSRGYPPSWDNVIYDSPSLGYVTATHQRGRDFGPTVLTYYLPMTDADPRAGRERLLSPTHEEWKDSILRDLRPAHPDIEKHIRKIDVFRWGHAMVQPRVGFVHSRARREAAHPQGRIHFAHSDLSGIAVFEEAFAQGVRAADEVMHALPSPA
ncbi:MAG: FAD-dependent oxidoreductase [Myxococcota bacterium]